LKLSSLASNQTAPANIGITKTVAIASDSAASDFYTADSAGINPTAGGSISNFAGSSISTLLPTTDQRGAARPFGTGYDVGAYESGEKPDITPSENPEVTERETLADTGLPIGAGNLGLVGLGSAAILGGSAGILRRRKKA
jgi:LPXTG-motif cell wall-anchored protein